MTTSVHLAVTLAVCLVAARPLWARGGCGGRPGVLAHEQTQARERRAGHRGRGGGRAAGPRQEPLPAVVCRLVVLGGLTLVSTPLSFLVW